MDTLEELQKKQNAVSLPSHWLHNYLTRLDKPDMIDGVAAANVLSVQVCLYSSSATQRERETDSCYWDQSANLHGTSSHTQVSANVCVSTCVSVFVRARVSVWVHAMLILSWVPSIPVPVVMCEGMTLTVSAYF